MARKRKTAPQVQKLSHFFSPASRGLVQDGAGGASPSSSSGSGSAPTSPNPLPGEAHRSPEASSPLVRSPAKSKPRLSPECSGGRVDMLQDSLNDTRELAAPINSFPTADKPLSDTMLKDMLVSLRSSLHADMMECMRGFKADVQELGGRVDHVEQKMGEFASSFNSLVDAHNDQEDELAWLKTKVSDLEDRSRRNNVKIRGVPESVLPHQLQQYAQDLMKLLVPDLSDADLAIDRIHRLPKPSYLPENIPRDVLMRVHFFQIKERFMMSFRKNKNPLPQYDSVQLFADLSQYTMQRRRALLPVTKALRNHDIVYRWGYPAKLTVTRDNHSSVVNYLTEGLALLRSWDIVPAQIDGDQPSASKVSTQDSWHKVTHKKKNKKRLS